MLTKKKALLELVLASFIWGFGFIATRWTLESVGPIGSNVVRFVLASSIGSIFVLPHLFSSERRNLFKKEFKIAFLAGFIICTALMLQTAGLQYTTVTNSGFITTLYALFVPVIELLFFRKRRLKEEEEQNMILHFLYLFLALFGVALISNFSFTNNFNRGDLYTLGCALISAAHILFLSRYSKKTSSPFTFNVVQSAGAAVAAILFLFLFQEKMSFDFTPRAWLGFLFLSCGSSLFAFFIQVRVQRVLSASTASLLFLLESPIAALLAFFIFAETLVFLQWVGAALILLAAIISLISDWK